MRVGIGVDAHALVEGVPLVLGGVEVESARGLAGHSDGDVIAHALIDAVLGAAGLGDDPQGPCAALSKRALERALLAERFEAAPPRRARGGERTGVATRDARDA